MEFFKMLYSTKSGRLGAAAILGIVAAYVKGDLGGTEAIFAGVTALQTLFIRDGVRKLNGK